ncbi:cobalt-factor II C(20)-methyltransferase [Streptococcus suis]|uniref:cobalt-factor II C(20)-methyltransferase n=1 Tax=Streptococcus suis TaxID=1307 RepID=UPI002AA45DCD|nr:cobalt-factor II C(20)-methyltransferase [Streptococcus suis]HEP1798138.1 cobalt-factor II C(20)-methyltransferase [Streptococcus suis]
MARFYGIGIGPGDSELVTVKASRILGELDILYTPEAKRGAKSLALEIAGPYLGEELMIKQRHFPMVRDKSHKEGQWQEIAEEIVADVQAGKNVGFITLGDPMVFSTYSYLLDLIGHRIETKTIPGITSYNSIAAEVGLPLVMDEESFAVVPATAGVQQLETVLRTHDTIVIMKVANHLAEVLPLLKRLDLLEKTILVSRSSTDQQEIRHGIVDLSLDEKLSYFSTMLVKKH